MLLETSYSSMKDGKLSIVAAPAPTAMVATIFSINEATHTSFFTRIVEHFSIVPTHVTFFDVRCAPSAASDVVSQIAFSGVLKNMLDWLPSHSRSCALVENICDALIRFFKFAANDMDSFSQALLPIARRLVEWSHHSDHTDDFHARAVTLSHHLLQLSEGNDNMLALLVSVPGWHDVMSWTSHTWSRSAWPSPIALPLAERERLKALGPQKMIAD
jgi:hypothetical protein